MNKVKAFRVFVRTWWKANPSWPNGREPSASRGRTLRRNLTEEEARAICKRYNETHEPGFLSRKAEYESR